MTIQYQGVWSLQSAAQLQSTQRWVTDPLYKNTTLLLQADDAANGAQNNTFLDSSSNAFAITRNGGNPGMTQGTFTPFSLQPGAWGNYFDGSSALSVSYLATNFGTGDFTVETFVFPVARTSSYTVLLDTRSAGTSNPFVFGFTGTNGYLYYYNGSVENASTTVIQLNTWSHVAISRSGSTVRLFVNGIQVLSVTDSSNLTGTSTGNVSIAQDAVAGSRLTGYLSNFRVVKGSAVYTSNFTPSPLPLTAITNTSLLTCQSSRFVDNSASPLTINITGTPSVQAFSPFAPQYQWTSSVIGGSGYFDGSGDYLTLADSTAWDLTGDYTIEMWVYPITTTSGLIGIGSYISPNNGLTLYYNTNKLELYVNGAAVLTGGSTIVKNQWNHIAVVRSGSSTNNTKLYLNGAQDGQGTNTTSFTGVAGNGVSINNDYANSYSANTGSCYMSGLRILNGVAQYTAAFTPPTAPPTAITNTSLLCNFTNAGIYDGTMKNNLETVGSAQISTAVVKYGSGSMYFDGTGDAILVSNSSASPNFEFQGDFTIELWMYIAGGSGNRRDIIHYDDGANGLGIFLQTTNVLWAGVVTYSASSFTPNLNTWYHVALVRSGTATNNCKLYVDGTQVLQFTNTATINPNATMSIGRTSTGANDLNGYIDDLRITKGYARYTANFIPPSVALPRQ